MATLDELAREIQRHYPRIYIACHLDHRARRGQGSRVSARDQTILAHISSDALRPRELAAHLRVAASTLSAALKRLSGMGLITASPDARDSRTKILRLTDKGEQALSQTSVLELSRLRAALGRLSATDRALVVRGLELLADAAQAAQEGK